MPPPRRRWLKWRKAALGVALCAAVAAVIVDAVCCRSLPAATRDLLDWVEDNGVAGLFVFAAVYAATVVCFIPAAPLTLGAGATFSAAFGLGPGVLLGSAAVLVGASVGAVPAFLVGRYVLNEWAQRCASRHNVVAAINLAFSKQPRRLTVLLRLSPVVPFSALNYVLSATTISLVDYCIGLVGIVPGTVAYVYVGAVAASAASGEASGDPAVMLTVYVVGGAATVAALALISVHAKRALRDVLAEAEAEEAERSLASAVDARGSDESG